MPRSMKTFKQATQSDQFVFTAEICPGEQDGPQQIADLAERFKNTVAGIQVREDPLQQRQLSALATSTILKRNGLDAIPEMSGAGRNQIALLSDLLGMRALGISSMMIPIRVEEHTAKSTATMVALVEELNEDESINADEEFLIGIQTGVQSLNAATESGRLAACAAAGARLLQIQPCFDLDALRQRINQMVEDRVTWDYAIMASLAVLPSYEAAQRLRSTHPESVIPPAVLERLKSADDPARAGFSLCCELIGQIRSIPGIAGIRMILLDDPQRTIDAIRTSDTQ